MNKCKNLLLMLCLGVSANFVYAYDGGMDPGYVAAASDGEHAGRGSNTNNKVVLRTQFGECVKNQYWEPDYQREECGEVIQRENLTLNSRVLFAYDKFDLSEQGKKTLANVIEKARENGEINYIKIVGHTDKIGTLKENQVLSEKRANAVGDYFVSLGIEPTYIDAIGDGENGAKVSDGCFDKDGPDPTGKMDALNYEAETASPEEKARIEAELKPLDKHLMTLSKCTAPDRRVDIMIETKGYAPQQQ